MKFSHIENDSVYIKGTTQESKDILSLVQNINHSSTLENYSVYTPEMLDEIEIEINDDSLRITKDHLNTIYFLISLYRGVGFEFSKTGISGETFLILENDIRDIHASVFPDAGKNKEETDS